MDKIGDNIWLQEGELLLLGVPFGVRMTIVRLSSGELWIHSPIAWSDRFREQLEEIGPVAYLVAPNNGHNKWLLDWHSQYPDAQVYVAPGTPAKKRVSGHLLLNGAVDAWTEDLASLQLPSVPIFDESLFLHSTSRSLIVTDLIQNHEGRRLTGLAGYVDRFLLHPLGFKNLATAPQLRWPWVIKDKPAFRGFVDELLSWDFERIIPTHGPLIEVDAHAAAKKLLESIQ